MATGTLGIRQRAILLILMAEAAEVGNPELHARYGVKLDGRFRYQLNELGLVASRKVGKAYAHELTDKGWHWCAEELGAEPPARAGSAGGALYALLAGLGRYLDGTGLGLAELFGPAAPTAPASPPPPDVEARIRDAYRRVVAKPRDWATLTDVRLLLGDVDRADVDAALRAMYTASGIDIAPEPNRKALTPDDHAAAIHIGGEDRHLLAIEGP
jgi:hypothetical protein